MPTSGTCHGPTLRSEIHDYNSVDAKVYCLGFGYDVDLDLLKAISLENGGEAFRIFPGLDASDQITDFYDSISVTLMGGLNFSYSPGASMWYPERVANYFNGSEIVVCGKYPAGSDHVNSTVNGSSAAGPFTTTKTFHADPDPDDEYVSRFWAYARINRLLDQILVDGESNATVQEIVSLAVKFNFVTPYTSFVCGDLLDEALASLGYPDMTSFSFSTSSAGGQTAPPQYVNYGSTPSASPLIAPSGTSGMSSASAYPVKSDATGNAPMEGGAPSLGIWVLLGLLMLVAVIIKWRVHRHRR
jgi:hypothetical protein